MSNAALKMSADPEAEPVAINWNWQPGDDPETHPMWDTQVELEYGMMRSGANKLRDAAIIAESRNQMTRLGVVRGLAADWVPGVADTIRQWVRSVEEAKGGPKPIAYPYVKALDPYVSAMIGVRTILNYIAQSKSSLVNIASEIGRTIEHEQKVRLWEEKYPDDFHNLRKDMSRKKVTTEHRRRTNVNRFHNHLKENTFEDLNWMAWPRDVVFRVGWTVMDCIIRKTGWFEVIANPDYKPAKNRSPQHFLTYKEGLTNWLAKALDHAELRQPDFRPTVVPPRRWTSSREGGYWTPYVKSPRLVRFKASQESQKEMAADEYDALDMPNVYRALNILQETPYAINKRVLAAVYDTWVTKRHIIKGMPELDDRELPPRTPRMIENREEGRRCRALHIEPTPPDEQTQKEIDDWKKKASPVYAFNAKRVSRMRATTEMLNIAEHYSQYEEFFFPHMLDFRGRMYPIPSFLNPQGNDLARGLLTFAETAPITKENGGVRWLAIHLASNWGHDKLPYNERVQWVYDNEPLLRRINEDPAVNNEWATADKPFQALAAVFEWVAYLDHGDGFESSLPVMVDGTCNGIQHLSALTRDRVAGGYVNLIPSDRPQDIYKFVARELQDTLETILKAGGEQAELARWWLELCDWDLPRSLTKRQVMVLPYGGTKDSFFGYTRAWIDEYHPKLGEGLDEKGRQDRKDRVVFLALLMWSTVNRVVKGGMTVMKWLQDCARCAAEEDQPIYWKVPSGFVVRHFYGLEKDRQVNLLLDGTRCQVKVSERTAKLSVREQLQGISPNFIHSLDASALTDCLNACADIGLRSFASVHDAYGTHAANMDTLAQLLRESFVRTHEHDVLGMFREACREVMVGPLVMKKGVDPMEAYERAGDILDRKAGRLDMGTLDLREVLNSEYFFA